MDNVSNTKTVIDGITFDSKKEAKRYSELKLLEKAGLIGSLQLQIKYELVPSQKGGIKTEQAINYVADFVYYDLSKYSAPMIIEDVKGKTTPVYIIKRKLMKLNGFEVTET